MNMWNIVQFNAIVEKYLYNRYEEYSQFINTYEDMLNEEENFDYHKFDELFENFTNNCERVSQTIARNVDLSLIYNKLLFYGI